METSLNLLNGNSSNELVVEMTDVLMDNLNTFNSAIAKAEFKEKLGRLLQYGARMISGLLTDSDKLSPSKDRQQLIAKVRSCSR
jgi:hypothetical protein